MVDAGAKGFLLKDSDISDVREAILTVRKGGSIFPGTSLYVIQKIKHREHESKTASLRKGKRGSSKICEGLSNQEIAIIFLSAKDCR